MYKFLRYFENLVQFFGGTGVRYLTARLLFASKLPHSVQAKLQLLNYRAGVFYKSVAKTRKPKKFCRRPSVLSYRYLVHAGFYFCRRAYCRNLPAYFATPNNFATPLLNRLFFLRTPNIFLNPPKLFSDRNLTPFVIAPVSSDIFRNFFVCDFVFY